MADARLPRRTVLGGGVALAAVVATGCGLGFPDPAAERPRCVARSALTGHRELGGARLTYEVDQEARTFAFDEVFYGRLSSWLDFFQATTGTRVTELRTFGSWTDGGLECSSWHDAGRAFDLAGLIDGGTELMSARYDRWRAEPDHRDRLRRYWATAASLHHHFADVLSYDFDAQHHNHLHVDNGQTGAELSVFRDGRSRVQNVAVQAICTHLWDRPVIVDGVWGGQTVTVVTEITDGLRPGELTDPDVWREFLRASTARFAS